MTDYAVKVTVRNGRILAKMRAKGIGTQTELAKRAGLGVVAVNSLITLRRPAVNDKGEWRYGVQEIAAVLCCDPEDLFTDAQTTMALERNSSEIFIDETQMIALSGGDMEMQAWAKIEAQRMLAKLPPRYADIVDRRMHDQTYESIGEDIGISLARVRQIEKKALRILAIKAKISDRDVDLAITPTSPR